MVTLLQDVVARRNPSGWANLDDFDLGPATATEPDLVIRQQNWSLYGLDEARDLAVFVDLPDDTDLAQSPFVYAMQHRLARRVLTIPLSEIDRLASQVPAVERVILVFSIGRCGSTLMSNALNAVPGVWCLSEPDAFSTLIMQHYHSPRRSSFSKDQIVRLIRACTRLQFRPPAGSQATVFAVKFRSQSLFQAELYHEALPEADFVFLYRDALGWANSIYSMMRQYGFGDTLSGPDITLPWSIFTAAADPAQLNTQINTNAPQLPMELTLAPAWACNMAEYSRQLAAGVPFFSLRYNELNKDRLASLAMMFRHCHLPSEALDAALAAFDADSQADSHLSREVTTERLTPARLARLATILSKDMVYGSPDLRLADIYT